VADRKSPGEITPPVSLHPLRFDEAMKALMGVEPQRVGFGNKQATHKPKSKGKKVPFQLNAWHRWKWSRWLRFDMVNTSLLPSPSSLGRCKQLIHRHGLDG